MMRHYDKIIFLFIICFLATHSVISQRARDLGVILNGKPGQFNAITDVQGVLVGHSTIIEGEGKLSVGQGPVRTGVTAIFPRGKTYNPLFAGWYSLNGNGEMTGTTWVEESGFLESPILITNTHSVGVVRDATIKWSYAHNYFDPLPDEPDVFWALPVVAETYDGDLNDINGHHVGEKHVYEALNIASGGLVEEGNVGGGTGMICHGFKGGIGTSSRIVEFDGHEYTIGVLVQSNYGVRKSLTISGVPVGWEITDMMPDFRNIEQDRGSIIVVVATDAPFLPHQLKRLARRVPIGISRLGGYGGNGSGDIFIAFSTANAGAADREQMQTVHMIPNDQMSAFFEATAEATEESIINALLAARTMTGINGYTVHALPHDRLVSVLRKYNRLESR